MLHIVDKIAGQFALDLRGNQGTDTQLSNLSPARHRHVPQALSIVTETLPHIQMGRRNVSHSTWGGIGIDEGRTASAGSIQSKMLPEVGVR